MTEVGTHAAEYERTLSDTELVGFVVAVDQRLQALLAQGVPLPMQQIENHHLIGLLEHLVGPDDSLRVREWHLTWVDHQLDAVEATMRMRLIESGIFNGSEAEDLPGFP